MQTRIVYCWDAKMRSHYYDNLRYDTVFSLWQRW